MPNRIKMEALLDLLLYTFRNIWPHGGKEVLIKRTKSGEFTDNVRNLQCVGLSEMARRKCNLVMTLNHWKETETGNWLKKALLSPVPWQYCSQCRWCSKLEIEARLNPWNVHYPGNKRPWLQRLPHHTKWLPLGVVTSPKSFNFH